MLNLSVAQLVMVSVVGLEVFQDDVVGVLVAQLERSIYLLIDRIFAVAVRHVLAELEELLRDLS